MKHTRKNKDERFKLQLARAKRKKELTKSQKATSEKLKEERENPVTPTLRNPYSYKRGVDWCWGHFISPPERLSIEKEIVALAPLLPVIKCQRCGKRVRLVEKSSLPHLKGWFGSGPIVIPPHFKRLTTKNFMQYESEARHQRQREQMRKSRKEYEEKRRLEEKLKASGNWVPPKNLSGNWVSPNQYLPGWFWM